MLWIPRCVLQASAFFFFWKKKINCCAWTCQFHSNYLFCFFFFFTSKEESAARSEEVLGVWNCVVFFFALQMPNKTMTADTSQPLKCTYILFCWINYWWLYLTGAGELYDQGAPEKLKLRNLQHTVRPRTATCAQHFFFFFRASDFKSAAV